MKFNLLKTYYRAKKDIREKYWEKICDNNLSRDQQWKSLSVIQSFFFPKDICWTFTVWKVWDAERWCHLLGDVKTNMQDNYETKQGLLAPSVNTLQWTHSNIAKIFYSPGRLPHTHAHLHTHTPAHTQNDTLPKYKRVSRSFLEVWWERHSRKA